MAAKRHRKVPRPAAGGPAIGATPPPGSLSSGPDQSWTTPAIFGIFLFSLLLACSPALDSKFSLPKLIVLGAGVFALSLLLIVRIWRGHSANPSRTVLLLTLALGGWWIASTPFALHLPTALNGEYDFYNGLWTHLCWLALFVASMFIPTDTLAARRIAALLVAAIVPVAAVNLLETTGLTTMGLDEVSTLGDRVAAGALMNFAIPFTAVALVRARAWPIRVGLTGMLVLFLLSEFLSQGRGPWIGLAVAAFVLIIGMAPSRTRWKAIAALLAAVVVLGGLTAKLSPLVAQRFATLTHVTQDESLNQRFVYYRAAFRAVQEHPVAGIGFENFRNSYPSYRGADDIWFFDNIIPTMVHNGYLETALNNGIPALLLYLALVATVLVKLGRKLSHDEDASRRALLLGVFAALSAYLVQDMSGWLNTGLASAFWITLGLAANLTSENAPRTSRSWARPLTITFSGAMIVLSLYLLNNGYARLVADARLFEAQSLDVAAQWRESQDLVKQGLAALPGDSRTEMVAGQIYVNRFVSSHDPEAYARAHELLEASYRHNRFDRMRLINIVALERAALDLGLISASSGFAQEALQTLTETDRDNPAFYEFKAKFFAAEGRFADAFVAIREARRLAPLEDRYRLSEAEYQRKASVQ